VHLAPLPRSPKQLRNCCLEAFVRVRDEELDPAALLRQALLELEEEWPELKKFAEQFRK